MKTFYSCIVCIICVSCIARAQVVDDFSDGNFTNNPAWTGDTAQFEINTANQLHLRSSGSDTSVLVTRNSRMKNTEWNFWMKLSFNTSSNNHARIYLTADTSALLSPVNGYSLQAGGGDDSIYIIKQTGTAVEKMLSFKSYKTVHSTNTLRVKIICDEYGNWEAMVDTTGGHNYISDGTFFDDSFQSSRWFGVFCRYTSSNSTKIYFDDFYIGPIIHDTLPPVIISQEVLTEKTVRLTFSEAVQKQGAEIPANYQVISTGASPDSVILDVHQPAAVNLFFHEPPTGATFELLRIRNIQDLSGNRLLDTIVQLCYYRPKVYDILIHELMADPDPPVELPNGEFVELYNRTMFPINLKDWTFRYGSYSRVFPSMTIPSKGYVLIVKDSAYLNFGKCAVLFTSSSSLSNEGTMLVLKDSHQHVIHSVSYIPDWFKGSFKVEGGWSLEMIDPSNPCGCGENWSASKDASGGTPGRANSNYKSNPDVKAPFAARAVISDSSLLEVYFSEAMDSTSLLSAANWVISPFENHPDGVAHPVRVVPVAPDFTSTELLLNETFIRGITYVLRVSGNMKDCAGNLYDSSLSIRFAIPDTVACHDLIINEILSDPASGGSRFIELYNRSEKIIDMRSLVLSNSDTSAGFLPNAMPLMSNGYLLFPGDYIAMTSSPDDICEKYRSPAPEAIVGMTGFPVFGDDTGTVVLARKDNLTIIDRMHYDPDMHYPLLITREGVSLERTNPEMPSDDNNNWHSAAETVGFATPAFQNSHRVMLEGTDQEITIEPDIFSPDNDGHDDLLNIIIRENDPDYAVSITVYDSRGRVVRQLVNNVLTGSEGFFVWDGMTANRSKASLGWYVLLIELTRPDGTVRRIKKTAVLGGKL
jgi:hypothetical protein